MEQLQQQIKVLENRIKLLENASTIPHPVEQAFRTRLRINTFTNASLSAKAANSENVIVNEAGSATYFVLGNPQGFLNIETGGTTYDIPFFT